MKVTTKYVTKMEADAFRSMGYRVYKDKTGREYVRLQGNEVLK